MAVAAEPGAVGAGLALQGDVDFVDGGIAAGADFELQDLHDAEVEGREPDLGDEAAGAGGTSGGGIGLRLLL